jgi:hypothetical protein
MMLNRVEDFTPRRRCDLTGSNTAIEWETLSDIFCSIEVDPFGQVKNRRILFDILYTSGACKLYGQRCSSMLHLSSSCYQSPVIPPAQDCEIQPLTQYLRRLVWLLPLSFVWKRLLRCPAVERARAKYLQVLPGSVCSFEVSLLL